MNLKKAINHNVHNDHDEHNEKPDFFERSIQPAPRK